MITPYSMPTSFCQQLGRIVSQELTGMAASFLYRGYIPLQLNQTGLILIPKIKCPTSFKDFRPISL